MVGNSYDVNHICCSGTPLATWLTGKEDGLAREHYSAQVNTEQNILQVTLNPPLLTFPAGQAKPQQIEAEFMFRSPTLVTGLDIGNFWSARYIATFWAFQMLKESFFALQLGGVRRKIWMGHWTEGGAPP